MTKTPEPVASVVIVSDFASGTGCGWDDLRHTLSALAQQDFDEPVKYILVEAENLRDQIPDDLPAILPALSIAFAPARNSYELKNAAIREASTEIVGMLDADCAPDPDWVRHMVTAMRANPNAAAVSGRTVYPGNDFVSRAAALVERAYVEGGARSETDHISNNGAGFRRSAYLQHPLPVDIGVFASQTQSSAMRRAGLRLIFEPRMRVTHAYDPHFEGDLRPAIGYGVIQIRRHDPRLRYAWLARLGYLSVPIFVIGRTLRGWMQAVRFHRVYGVSWYELPAVFAFAAFGCLQEIPGMLRAVNGLPPPVTRFR